MGSRNAFAGGLVLALLGVLAARAEDPRLEGRWVMSGRNLAIEAEFRADGTYRLVEEEDGRRSESEGRFRLEGGVLLLSEPGEPTVRLAFSWKGPDAFEARDEDGAAYVLRRAAGGTPAPGAPGPRRPDGLRALPLPAPAPDRLPVPADLRVPLPLPRHPAGHVLFTRHEVRTASVGGVSTPVVVPRIHVMNGDGTGARPFLATEDFTGFRQPRWSAPYDRIGFTSDYRGGRSACYEDVFCLHADGSRLQRVTGAELHGPPPAGYAAVTGFIRDNVTGERLEVPDAGGNVNALGTPVHPRQILIAVQGSDGVIHHPDPPQQAEITIVDPATGLPVKVGGLDAKRQEWQYRFRIPRCAAGHVWIRVWMDRWIGNLVFATLAPGTVTDVGEIPLSQGNFSASQASFTPDGRYAVGIGSISSYDGGARSRDPTRMPVRHGGADNVCAFDMRTGAVVAMFEATLARGESARDPVLSPDGRSIALAWGPFGAENLAVLPLEDLLGRRLTPRVVVPGQRLLAQGAMVGAGTPTWSPDGRLLAFTRGFLGTPHVAGDVWVVAADGSGLRQVTRVGPNAMAVGPSFSPDGRRLAFAVLTSPDGVLTVEKLVLLQVRSDVWTVDLDGANAVRLTDDGRSSEPAWGP